MRCIAKCDVPWIAAIIVVAIYLLFFSRNMWGLVLLVGLAIVVFVWMLLWRRSCRLPAPPKSETPLQ